MAVPREPNDAVHKEGGSFDSNSRVLPMTKVKNDIRFICPFCKLDAAYGEMGEDNHPLVLHALPMCTEFEKLSPDEYVRRVRIRYSG